MEKNQFDSEWEAEMNKLPKETLIEIIKKQGLERVPPYPNNYAGVELMQYIGKCVENIIPGLGYALLIFQFDKPGLSNYLSNAKRSDMITSLEETLKRWKKNEDIPTPSNKSINPKKNDTKKI